MLGALIGDIVGSRFEFNNHRSKEFDLFTADCFVTDDSIMTLSVAKAIMETAKEMETFLSVNKYNHEFLSLLEESTIKYMQKIGRKYPYCGYGGLFVKWVFSNNPTPYNSYGNGAAMRVSPVGFAAQTEAEAQKLSNAVTGVTHNHEEGIKGAEAVAISVFVARKGYLKSEIRKRVCDCYYPLDFRIDEIRKTYLFNETCQQTVPQAIEAFLESSSFEDSIRTAVSLGGDSDTIAAITGAIAEAYYGIPTWIKEKALTHLDDELLTIYNEWVNFVGETDMAGQFKILTKYIKRISCKTSFGEWVIDKENDGTAERPIQMPFVSYAELVNEFVEEFYQFSESCPEYELTSYSSILEKNGIKWDYKEMQEANPDKLDAQGILALIMGAIRADRFSEGALLRFFEDGYMLKWLSRLKALDEGVLK